MKSEDTTFKQNRSAVQGNVILQGEAAAQDKIISQGEADVQNKPVCQEKSKIDAADKQFRMMTETSIPFLVTKLGIPTTISMLISNIYNMADTYFVGREGTSASGAIGIVFGLMAIIQAFGFMLGHGAGAIIANKLGARDYQSASRFASISFFMSLAVGSLITISGFIFLNPLLYLLGSTSTILPFARTYAVFILLGAPFLCASCVLNNILRYEGRAFFAMIGLSLGGILNIFGDWYFMRILNMGVEGAGMSTAISQAVGFIVLLIPFLRKITQSRISVKKLRNIYGDLLQICKTGFPSLIRQGLSSTSTMVLNHASGIYGDAAVAAMSIAGRIQFFMFAVALGIGQGFQPVSAFNYGAGKYKRVRQAFWFTCMVSEMILVIAAIALSFKVTDLIRLFRDDPKVIEIGTAALRFMLFALVFQPLFVCANMLFQSIGKAGAASFLSLLRSGLYFIPVILILPGFIGIMGIQMSSMVGDILTWATSIPFIVSFFKKLPKTDA